MALQRPAAGELTGPSVSFGWGEWGVRTLAPEARVVVIVDVLSFSTAVSIAVTRGATVLPHGFDAGGAADYARSQDAVLAVHRREETPDQPFSLSPVSMLGARPGTRIVLPSPNGATLSRLAEAPGRRVLAGCLRNAAVSAADAAASGSPIAVIAAGERWPDDSLRPALEDLLGAGSIVAALGPDGSLSPEARVVAAAFRAAGDVAALIEASTSGRELVERGAAGDVALAVELDADPSAAVLEGAGYVAAGPSPI